jgi:hypothetical protein
MSLGTQKVTIIMAGLERHIKNGADPITNRQHYNFVYEAFQRELDYMEKKKQEFLGWLRSTMLSEEQIEIVEKKVNELL